MKEETVPYRQLRKKPEEVKALLDRLDQRSEPNPAARSRRTERFSYRAKSLKVEIPQPGGGANVYSVPTRNISREGLSFLISHFVYPKTHCVLHLLSMYNHTITRTGVIVRCRYLEGSGGLHEAGVKFDRPIDVALFHHGAARIRLLLATPDPALRQLVERLLKPLNAELICADNGRKAAETALANCFDLALLEMELPELDGFGAARELRERGYIRPVVALTAKNDEAERAQCFQAGFSLWLPKPLTREALLNTVLTLKDDPLLSSLAYVPEMADPIDQFVLGLSEQIKKLEAAFRANDAPFLLNLAHDLKEQGTIHGFETITQAAAELEQTWRQNQDIAARRAKLTALVRLCLAARSVSGAERP